MEEETNVSSPNSASDTAQNPTFSPVVIKKSKNNGKLKRKKKKVCILKDGSDPTALSSSSGVVCRRRGARLSLGAGRSAGFAEVDAVALPLGMSFAAVVAQVCLLSVKFTSFYWPRKKFYFFLTVWVMGFVFGTPKILLLNWNFSLIDYMVRVVVLGHSPGLFFWLWCKGISFYL